MRQMKAHKSSGYPVIELEDFVPPSIVRDVRREVSRLLSIGARGILIQIPIEDFNTTINTAIDRHPFGKMPFEPRLCGQPVASWTGSHVAVMGQKPKEPTVRLFGADGKEYDLP